MSRSYTLAPSWRCLLTHERSDLRWVTVIFGAIRVTDAEAKSASAQADILIQVQKMIAAFEADWLGLTRGRHLSGVIWRGAYELELHRELEPETHRYELLESLGYDVTPLAPDERLLVPHVHFVIALGKRTPDDLKNALARWTGKWQTMAKNLKKKQTVEEAITNLASYSHKRMPHYSTGGLGNVPVKYGAHYGLTWLRFIDALYDGFDTEFRSKK
ncbi:hypothetical protein KBI52_02665 [Microvirga sp. HBU67558]|uniref:hypothetical protein n=1 Tax=Microvirga TaxID=186650 RepID=UPI001B35B3BC|nr:MULTISPECIES: hypothetical protein [unclassified Microvirga]MBQ0819147.1 hypothetical protein [Microvirga sp. HBU67558]